MSGRDYNYYSDDQEVTRTVGDLKKFANTNWWVGFGSGTLMILGVLGLFIAIGLYYNI